MPRELEEKLKKQARKKKVKDEGAYVYGTMRKTGWKPKREQKAGTKKRQSTRAVGARRGRRAAKRTT